MWLAMVGGGCTLLFLWIDQPVSGALIRSYFDKMLTNSGYLFYSLNMWKIGQNPSFRACSDVSVCYLCHISI